VALRAQDQVAAPPLRPCLSIKWKLAPPATARAERAPIYVKGSEGHLAHSRCCVSVHCCYCCLACGVSPHRQGSETSPQHLEVPGSAASHLGAGCVTLTFHSLSFPSCPTERCEVKRESVETGHSMGDVTVTSLWLPWAVSWTRTSLGSGLCSTPPPPSPATVVPGW
jgi:hypothetical protein